MSIEVSLLVGLMLGVIYTSMGLLVIRISQKTSKFVPIVVGGMVSRLVMAMVAILIITQLFSAVYAAFMGAFVFIVILGIFCEIIWLLYYD